ncbi:hypothetical protein NEOKW01_0989 [Nematocida sp. AWRm80]|nr:hypothetical protein NEOKW01_0989 [Nematocida sp. AWRm80]
MMKRISFMRFKELMLILVVGYALVSCSTSNNTKLAIDNRSAMLNINFNSYNRMTADLDTPLIDLMANMQLLTYRVDLRAYESRNCSLFFIAPPNKEEVLDIKITEETFRLIYKPNRDIPEWSLLLGKHEDLFFVNVKIDVTELVNAKPVSKKYLQMYFLYINLLKELLKHTVYNLTIYSTAAETTITNPNNSNTTQSVFTKLADAIFTKYQNKYILKVVKEINTTSTANSQPNTTEKSTTAPKITTEAKAFNPLEDASLDKLLQDLFDKFVTNGIDDPTLLIIHKLTFKHVPNNLLIPFFAVAHVNSEIGELTVYTSDNDQSLSTMILAMTKFYTKKLIIDIIREPISITNTEPKSSPKKK